MSLTKSWYNKFFEIFKMIDSPKKAFIIFFFKKEIAKME